MRRNPHEITDPIEVVLDDRDSAFIALRSDWLAQKVALYKQLTAAGATSTTQTLLMLAVSGDGLSGRAPFATHGSAAARVHDPAKNRARSARPIPRKGVTLEAMVLELETMGWLALAASIGCAPDDARSITGAVPGGAGPLGLGGSGLGGGSGPSGSGVGGGGSGVAVSGSDGGGPAFGRAGATDTAGDAVEGASGGALDASAPEAGVAAPCLEFSAPVAVGTIELAEVDQLSGFVASRARDGVLFAHEDSTGAPIVYALDTAGRRLAAFTLEGAPNTDWEDIALGPGPGGAPHLFIGDIGDNAVRTGGVPRAELAVIRLPEPEVAVAQAFVEETLSSFGVLRFTYPSGEHDAETLMVHPGTGDLLIVTRSAVGDSRVYRAPGSTPPDTVTVLEEIGRVAFDSSGQGALATAGDISPAGDRVLIRTYTDVYLWPAPLGWALDAVFRGTPAILPWAVEPQGEAISFVADGHAWLSGSEQSQAIYRSDEACPE